MINFLRKFGKNINLMSLFGLILFFIFIGLLLIQHNYVFYAADDFCRGEMHLLSLKEVIKSSLSEYMGWTGRFFSTLATYFFLNGHIFIWRLLNPLIIVFLVLAILGISITKISRPTSKISGIFLVLYLFMTLNQNIAREVLYWVTGSLNYLWPLTAALVFEFFWYKSFGSSQFACLAKYSALIISVFAGVSNEQVAPIFFLLTLLITLSKLRQGYKLDKIHFLASGILFISVLLVLFAPGNFIRFFAVDDKSYFSKGLISILDRRLVAITDGIFHSAISDTFLGFFFIGSLLTVINLISFKESTIKLNNKLILVLLLATSCLISLLNNPTFISYFPLKFGTIFSTFSINSSVLNIHTIPTYLFWSISIASTLYFGLLLYRQDKSPIFLCTTIAAIMSQTIMLAFQFSPYRSFFLTIILLIIGIAYLTQRLEGKYISRLAFLLTFLLFLRSLFSYSSLIKDYQINASINSSNEKTIEEYENKQLSSPLVLKRLTNDLYSFDLPYMLVPDWGATSCFKKYFKLKGDEKIIWVK